MGDTSNVNTDAIAQSIILSTGLAVTAYMWSSALREFNKLAWTPKIEYDEWTKSIILLGRSVATGASIGIGAASLVTYIVFMGRMLKAVGYHK